MSYTRREFGKLALAGLPAAAMLARTESIFGAFARPSRLGATAGQAQAKPNSVVHGVQLGAITYSFRAMPDQSAEATLKYVLDSGISAIELMGGPVESFAGAPAGPGRGGGQGGGRGGGRRGADPNAPSPRFTSSWNGQPCNPPAPEPNRPRPEPTPEEIEHAAKLKAWRTSVSMEPFKKLRKMYNDAGVTIYAWKQLNANMSDEEYEYIFNVAEALGCSHTTLEILSDPALLKRVGAFAEKKKIYAAYHTHLQGSMTAFDQAFAISKGNMANVDFGHWVAAGNIGGTPMDFLNKHHARISSFHLKDRTTPEKCGLNLPLGEGETPVKEILQLVKKNRWKIPASIEMEYTVPEGSDPVQEVRKCVEYCRKALA